MLPKGFKLKTLKEIGCFVEPPEPGDTLQENSLLKAKYVWENYKINALADDTGLEVYSLNGAPGVHSARYAGEAKKDTENVKLLLQNLEDFPDRRARFRTVITVILDGQVFQFEGRVEGAITLAPQGEGGFGYDPIFRPLGHNKTFSEMTLEEKNKLSHRAKAIREMALFLGIVS